VADNESNEGRDENLFNPEVRGDGFLFKMNDDVHLFINMQSPTVAMVQMWRVVESKADDDENDTIFVAPDSGNIFSTAFRKRLAEVAATAFGEKAPTIAEDIEHVAHILGAPNQSGKSLLDELQEAQDRSTMERLIIYARAGASFFHNSEKEGFASVKRESHRENYEIASPTFKLWLRSEFWRREKERLEKAALEGEGGLVERDVKTGLPAVVRDRDLGDAVRQLESIAIFESQQAEVYIRTAGAAELDKIYIDLGDEEWRAIEVSPEGWRIVAGDDIPVRFVRPRGLLPLPEPVPSGEGSLDGLMKLLNLGDGEEATRNRALILAWLSHAYLPTGPFPVLTLMGPQGAAKSHALRILRNLVDPSVAPGSTKPRNEHDAYIDASANWVIAYDNLPTVPPWLSNVLCDIATGGGFRTRTLYTNRDQEIFQDKRPIILAGIGSVATRPDLLDRAAIINLPRIDKKARKKEAVINRMLAEVQPSVLSALLDAASVGLAKKDDVVLEELPRMADFAAWGVATEEAFGAPPGAFMEAYTSSRQDASGTALEAWPMADTFVEFAARFVGEENAWAGTATALLTALNDSVEDDDLKRVREWPGSASALSGQIGGLIPDLLENGISITSTRDKSKRVLRVFMTRS